MMKPECWVACPLFSLQADTLRSDQSLLLRRVLGRILDFPTNDNIERVTSGSNGHSRSMYHFYLSYDISSLYTIFILCI